MIREILTKLFLEYPKARQEPFTSHPLAAYLRDEVPEKLRITFPSLGHLIFQASPGQGQWADAPWIAVFDPTITQTAQRGYYPVFLFSRSMESVYLSLNQGMTELRQEHGYPQTREILRTRARIMRSRLENSFLPKFGLESIALEASHANDRLAMYEPGHTIGRLYRSSNLPSENELVLDLLEMVELYQSLTFLGGYDDLDAIHKLGEEAESYSLDSPLEEKRRLALHKRIERNRSLAKQAKLVHGYRCQVCKFDYFEKYGELGKDYIEAHHKVPLSQLDKNKPAMLSPEHDFAVVCANCHRMIHRPGAPKTWEEFLLFYQEQNRE